MTGHLMQDLRYAWRSLFKNPGFTATAIITLALGIGANSAIFSVVERVLLRPLAYPEPDRLVMVWGKHPTIGHETASLPDFLDWREGNARVVDLAAFSSGAVNFTGEGEPERLRSALVSANFFRVVATPMTLGRSFEPSEEIGRHAVVVLSDGLWRSHFGASPGIVGRTMSLNGAPFTVIGVAPPAVEVTGKADLWLPLRTDTVLPRRADFLGVIGRLRPGVTLSQAQAQLATTARGLAERYPATNATWSTEAVPLRTQVVGKARTTILIFMAGVALVLLIACANVANLILARATGRTREMAVRTALGARRGRLLRQLLTESLMLTLIGAVVGLLLASWSVDAIRTVGARWVPRAGELHIDGLVIGYSLLLAVVTGTVLSLVPALRLRELALHGALRAGSRSATDSGRLRASLVFGEVALTLMLLAGAGLMLRSFARLDRVDPGFTPAGLLTYRVTLPSSRYPTDTALSAAYDALLEHARAIPGVTAASAAATLPMQGTDYLAFTIAGREPAGGSAVEDAQVFPVTADYLRTMQIGVRRGRGFEPADAGGRPVALISSAMAAKYFADRDPLGQRLTFGDPTQPASTWFTVVGVVDDVAQEGLSAHAYPQVYVPLTWAAARTIFIVLRGPSNPDLLSLPARAALREVDPSLPAADIRSMASRVADDVAQPRVSVAVLLIFAAVALTLAAVGIYGVMSYAVAQRTREIGLRMALGAQRTDVLRLVVRQGMAPAVAGIAVGLLGGLAVTRLMSSLLFGIGANDPLTFAAVTIFLAAVAATATYLPARRATRVDPTIALRAD